MNLSQKDINRKTSRNTGSFLYENLFTLNFTKFFVPRNSTYEQIKNIKLRDNRYYVSQHIVDMNSLGDRDDFLLESIRQYVSNIEQTTIKRSVYRRKHLTKLFFSMQDVKIDKGTGLLS